MPTRECIYDDDGGQDDDGNPPTQALRLAAGRAVTCWIDDRDHLQCWGDNEGGTVAPGDPQAEISTPNDPFGEPVVAVDLSRHACAASEMGPIECWGDPVPGCEGEPTPCCTEAVPRIAVSQQAICVAQDDQIRCCSDDEGPGSAVAPVGIATHLAAGRDYACAVIDGAVQCWGDPGPWIGVDGYQPDDTPSPVELGGATATEVVIANQTTCAIADGRVYCWGNDDCDELGGVDGDGGPAPLDIADGGSIVALEAGFGHLCALTAQGQVWCWGEDDVGQASGQTVVSGDCSVGNIDMPGSTVAPHPIPIGQTVSSIAAGSRHTCALRTDGQITCWGSDSHGQLQPEGSCTPTDAEPRQGMCTWTPGS